MGGIDEEGDEGNELGEVAGSGKANCDLMIVRARGYCNVGG